MNRISAALRAASAALSLAAGWTSAQAQDTSAGAEAQLLLVRPLTLVKDKDLDFGGILPGPTQGFVVMDPDGGRTTSGGVRGVALDAQPATFYGYGAYLQRVRIRLDANQYTLRRQGGNQTMRLDRLTISSQPPTVIGAGNTTFYIGKPDGFFHFSLGGRLRVGANQAPGVYDGQFTVTIEYL